MPKLGSFLKNYFWGRSSPNLRYKLITEINIKITTIIDFMITMVIDIKVTEIMVRLQRLVKITEIICLAVISTKPPESKDPGKRRVQGYKCNRIIRIQGYEIDFIQNMPMAEEKLISLQ